MDDLHVIDSINNAGGWLVRNQALLLSYAVNIVAAIAIIIVGMIVARVISNAVNRLMLARHIDATVADFLSALVRYGIIAFTLIAALGRVGVQTASVIAVLGAAGLAVGLALQGSLSNLAAGVLLVTFRPFRAGEYVDLGGVAGSVLHVQIFSTTLRTADGRIVVVPNGKIIAGNIINFSREPVRRNEFIIGVSYDADIDKVRALLTEIIESDDRILKDREMTVRMNELGASSVNFVIRVWSKSSDLQAVYWDVLERIKKTLDANDIGIPYPQMDVHYKPVNSDAQEKAPRAEPQPAIITQPQAPQEKPADGQ
ncbi:small-conductance mechanosensitive channel MscS [Cronobacter dublinensis]|uniref:small-conductance mechanosensitive channel MscS n=1 Tax=Cronobacter dublinensis TaxID=413497 RepID=UPI00029BEBF3|nr:small-conductance mechanosensitive channel MscS [Cronobacter dublinensis]MDI6440131.1 small-conductance mechanosensitive channel MscS [Cronobacter dublinensis]NCH96908.1 small-conductance mechanosensitive channel MscS [Cronobacter dublinensis]CCJ86070.1 Protein involved in stability of MscS mechanosensitive channel [Cronobacter dublinensis 582]